MATSYETLRADIVAAVKSHDAPKALALRTADAAIQRASIDSGQPIDDAMVTSVLRKAVKNLADAREEFAKGGRADLVAANEVEIRFLGKYLPQALAPARLEELVSEAIRETGATSRKEMGKIMAALKQRPEAPLIDFAAASKLIQSRLTPAIPPAASGS